MQIEIKDVTVAATIPQWEKWLQSVASDSTVFSFEYYVTAWAKKCRMLNKMVHEIDETDINLWVNAENAGKVSTRKMRLHSLRSFFRYCSAKRHAVTDPTILVKVKRSGLSLDLQETTEKKCFSDESFARLIATFDAHREKRHAYFWKPATLIGRCTGLRMGDIAMLEWPSFKPNALVVWTDKRDTRVEISMTPELEYAAACILIKNERFCFPAQRALNLDKSKRAALSSQFEAWLTDAKIEGHSFHDLRHTLLTELFVVKKLSLEEVAARAGHISATTTLGYIHDGIQTGRQRYEKSRALARL